jgi:hypothetical protein
MGTNRFGPASHDLKLFLDLYIFSPDAPWNKLCVSTNFIILGTTDQKLWVFEVFRRSLGMAGMCWSQPARLDHMCKKWRAG